MDYILTEEMLGIIKEKVVGIDKAMKNMSKQKDDDEIFVRFRDVSMAEFEGMIKGISLVLKIICGKGE